MTTGLPQRRTDIRDVLRPLLNHASAWPLPHLRLVSPLVLAALVGLLVATLARRLPRG